jgi:serine/threonine protein kinase
MTGWPTDNHGYQPITNIAGPSKITDAMAWLEKLRIAHCDLRPPNILLDPNDDIKLCDFEGALEYGQPLLGAHKPYYQWPGDDEGYTG